MHRVASTTTSDPTQTVHSAEGRESCSRMIVFPVQSFDLLALVRLRLILLNLYSVVVCDSLGFENIGRMLILFLKPNFFLYYFSFIHKIYLQVSVGKEKLETLLALETTRVHSVLGGIYRRLDLKAFKML